jgi:hypothetical protein
MSSRILRLRSDGEALERVGSVGSDEEIKYVAGKSIASSLDRPVNSI